MKIYAPPEEVGDPPNWESGMKLEELEAKENAWIESLRSYCQKYGKGPLRGKEVSFPYADGRALYMVFTPGSLIHLAVGDAWQYQLIERLTSKDIATRIKQQEGLAKLFPLFPVRKGGVVPV